MQMNPNREHPLMGIETAVREFMVTGEQSLDRFNAKQASLYTGLQFEELAEKLEAIAQGALTEGKRSSMLNFARVMREWSDSFKTGAHEGDIGRADHADLIDADIDLAWVSLGALYSTALSGPRAISHCVYTNLDKFRNGCVKDANGKIQKPADWQPPNFEPYVDFRAKDD